MTTAGQMRTVVAAVAVGAACIVQAAGVYTNSASGNWDASGSWTGGKPAAGGASDAALVFAGAGNVQSTNNLAGAFFLNRLTFASGNVLLAGNTLAFTNNGATGPQLSCSGTALATLLTPISLGGDTTVAVDGVVTNIGVIGGKGGLIKTGTGTLVYSTNLNAALSYAGATIVSNGALVIATTSARNSMSSTNVTVLGGATLVLQNNGANVSSFNLPNSAVVNVASAGAITSDVPTISCGTMTASGGATIAGSSGCLSLHAVDAADSPVALLGSVTLKRIILEPYSAVSPTQTLRFDGTGAGLSIGIDSGTAFSFRPGSSSGLMTYVMDIADSPSADIDFLVPFVNFRPGPSGSLLSKRGAGVMQVNGVDWSLATYPTKPFACDVVAGTLIWNTSATNGVAVNLSGITVENGATLQVGTNGLVGAIYSDVTNNGTLAFCRSDAYAFTNAITGTGNLVQKGSGTLTLTGTSSFSGATTVRSGTLMVGATGVLGGGGTVTVSGGVLTGTGTIGSSVVLPGGGSLLPGGSNTVGTLTISNAGATALTLSGGGLFFDLSNTSGVCDQLAVAGTLVLNGANRISLSFPSGTPPAGTYTLMTYAAKSGTGTLTLNSNYPNATLTVSDTHATLTVTGAGIRYLKWTGGASGTWDTTSANWTLDGVSSAYSDGVAVLFDDTASNFTVAASSAVSPSSVTFNNAASNYTLSASIAGASVSLIKSGAKKTTLSGANTYGGGTVLAGGTLSVGASANLPASGSLTFSGGVLQLTGSTPSSLDGYTVNWDSFNGGFDVASGNTLAVTNTVGGSGGLSKAGAGSLVLSGANGYGGGTSVSAGYLQIGHSQALGTGPVDMAAGELDLLGGLVCTNAITVRGSGLINSAGSLQSANGTTNTWAGPVTLGDSNARLGSPGGVLVVNGPIGSGANTFDLIVRNPNGSGGTVVLGATNAWRGNLWVRCGTVRIGTRNAVPVSSVLNLGLEAGQTGVTNAVFDLGGFDQEVAGLVDRGTDNLHAVTCSASTFATLTVNTPSTSYAFSGTLSGNLRLAKTGGGTLTLTGTNATFGGFAVNAGTLAVSASGTLGVNSTNVAVNAGTLSLSNSVSIADNAVLKIADGGAAKVFVASGVNEAVGYLFFGDRQRPGGTYGATGSGARVIDDEHFSGGGVLSVLHGNGGTVLRLQ